MPCCAFAAFLLGQLLLGLAALKRLLLGRSAAADAPLNVVVEWRLAPAAAGPHAAGPHAAAPVLSTRRRHRVWTWSLAGAAVLEAALLLGAIQFARTHFLHTPAGAHGTATNSLVCGEH